LSKKEKIMSKKKSIIDFKKMKKENEKITWMSIYDYHTAKFAERAGLDMILVGDSLGGCVYGYPDDGMPVTMDQCVAHANAVRRGAPNTFVMGDLPFLSYEISAKEAIRNAGRLYKEAGVDCVKPEGGVRIAKVIRAIVDAGMVVCGHIGLLSQSVPQLGGHRVQGRTAGSALEMIKDARAVQEAGASLLCIEAITSEVAEFIAKDLEIPVLGIASGPNIDGQTLIVNDVLGITEGFDVGFYKKYANLNDIITKAIKSFTREVTEGVFPQKENWHNMSEAEYEKFLKLVD
jgi:3-methyl-2-oxobutanoate hydroxymethyltransferase